MREWGVGSITLNFIINTKKNNSMCLLKINFLEITLSFV